MELNLKREAQRFEPKRDLVIVVQGDITVVQSGARYRFSEMVDFLANHFDNIILYSLYEDGERPWDENAISRFSLKYPNIRLVLDHKPRLIKFILRIKNVILALSPQLIDRVMRMKLPFINPEFGKLRDSLNNPCFLLCGVDNLLSMNGIPKSTVISDTLDVKFLHVAIARNLPVYDLRIIIRMRSELALLSFCQMLIAISPPETALFRALVPPAKCLFVPSFHEDVGGKTAIKAGEYVYDLLFVGTDYHFNVSGLVSFLQINEAWLGDLKIAVAGKVSLHPQVVALASTRPGISLLGFVAELAPLYAQSKLVVSPVEGTGLKIKMLEALKNGTPVIASVSSMIGLPHGYEACVFPIERSTTLKLLTDPSALAAAEAAVHQYLSAFTASEDRTFLLRYLNSETTV